MNKWKEQVVEWAEAGTSVSGEALYPGRKGISGQFGNVTNCPFSEKKEVVGAI